MILHDIRIRYLLLLILLTLNFLQYLNNPLTHSDAVECIGIKCRPFALIITILSFTFLSGMMVSMGILNKSIVIPKYWYVPIIIIGGITIIYDWCSKKIVKPMKNRIIPPPEGYIPKIRRIILNFSILFIYLLLFIANFIADRVPTNSNKFSEVVFYSAFGSLNQNPIAFFAGWLSSFGIITAMINIYFAETFYPQKYNLPYSWKL